MPQSRKRQGHHEFHKPSPIPAKQRTKGRITMSILFAVFGLLIGLFAAGDSYVVMFFSVVLGAVVGYIIGRNMEASASKKD